MLRANVFPSRRSGDSTPDGGLLFPEEAVVDRSYPAAEQIYRLLRRAIVTWRLRPGDAISDTVVTHRFHVSRTPLREAYRRLAQDGLVVIRPQAGTFVSPLDERSLGEGRLIRRALEVEGIRLAATRMREQDIDILAALLDREERAVERTSSAAALDLDDEFHATISKLSGFPRLWTVIDGAKAQIDRLRFAALTDRGLIAVAEHRQILDALKARNPPHAADLLAAHLDHSDEDLTCLPELDVEPERAGEFAPADRAGPATPEA